MDNIMAKKCIASIDQGTSSSRVLIVCSSGTVLASHQIEHTQYYPSAGFVEHDPLEIWKNVKICLAEALKKVGEKIKIVGIGITNQRETTVVWNKNSGKPYKNAIVWNDTRTCELVEELTSRFGSADHFRAKTGLPIATYFSASKLMHLLREVPRIREDAKKGDALFGTIDTWLMWKLTNGKVHATDVTNASRTLMMNLETLQWDEDILHALDIPASMLPAIHPSSFLFGHADTKKKADLEDHQIDEVHRRGFCEYEGVPISGVLGDQQAALFGQTCFARGEAKCTYGTGAFLLLNTGHDAIPSTKGLLTTVAYQLNDGKAVYALEGAIAYSGSVVQWLRDNLKMINQASETEDICHSVTDNGGVYFVPAFAGLYAPYWRGDARGVITGLTAYNTKAHIIRAALEASAFQTVEVIQAMDKDSGSKAPMSSLKVDGGLTANNFVMQFQSDLLKLPLIKPKVAETTALGAAYVSGLAVGLWENLDEIKSLWKAEKEWNNQMGDHERATLLHHWQKALARSLYWKDNAHFDEKGIVKSLEKLYHSDPYVARLHGHPLTEVKWAPESKGLLQAISPSQFVKKAVLAGALVGFGFVAGLVAANFKSK